MKRKFAILLCLVCLVLSCSDRDTTVESPQELLAPSIDATRLDLGGVAVTIHELSEQETINFTRGDTDFSSSVRIRYSIEVLNDNTLVAMEKTPPKISGLITESFSQVVSEEDGDSDLEASRSLVYAGPEVTDEQGEKLLSVKEIEISHNEYSRQLSYRTPVDLTGDTSSPVSGALPFGPKVFEVEDVWYNKRLPDGSFVLTVSLVTAGYFSIGESSGVHKQDIADLPGRTDRTFTFTLTR